MFTLYRYERPFGVCTLELLTLLLMPPTICNGFKLRKSKLPRWGNESLFCFHSIILILFVIIIITHLLQLSLL
jgi:hypothetical protein